MAHTSEETTKTQDKNYNAVSVLYHTLQEGETIERYIRDARENGDDELAEFFSQVQSQDRERAQRAKQLLKARL
ncbi:hypothetical protein [Allosalinactinospora lopnorensis]|uniref:hypothetical protein n=1 Tax=Allosalinactinospora lopnorensis TaxID=1352348 RepID=UPI000623DD6A|nr:hypothetical protein [Allosalinactinospora lopnorensis]